MPVYPTPFYSLDEKKKKQKKREREWGVALGGKHALKCICYNTHHKEGGKEERKKERKKERKRKKKKWKSQKKKRYKMFFLVFTLRFLLGLSCSSRIIRRQSSREKKIFLRRRE